MTNDAFARDHVARNLETYDAIADHYDGVTAAPAIRAWKEASMRRFAAYLPGTRVLVPGCGEGRDSRYLQSLDLEPLSFDLSSRMLALARGKDPHGRYTCLDLRDMNRLPAGAFDGIWASGCLYHLTKAEFIDCIAACRALLAHSGVLYVSMKEGQGERYEEPTLGPRYPGGDAARALLRGVRFYAYYQRDELLAALAGFDVLHEQRVEPAEGGFEFWLRKSDACAG
ncbi:bifunctional 2-polyprenyl-6-hydroxyphenol methylase/3-demethylubiquinol 3-O-methyltransferase UbiG [Reyranella sp. CPCC 100927]|uniref:class I SAM-dependent methyltransferase n=1 Tax=Reyranella sp. CPCC 100927 TaxID=2599616 RepID=UPI0011B5B771|nr:class I SAM-dependent methyltransferase [Reyranella sp. CPCC 100927]TWT03777.1 class I SAM-dependent methyltransferase [Reyranella sp. CPCC 100927]